jgi:hypothetical protein
LAEFVDFRLCQNRRPLILSVGFHIAGPIGREIVFAVSFML